MDDDAVAVAAAGCRRSWSISASERLARGRRCWSSSLKLKAGRPSSIEADDGDGSGDPLLERITRGMNGSSLG